jgi:hypothetical protein
MRKPISLAIGGGGRLPSRIAHIASIPGMPIAAFAAGPGRLPVQHPLPPQVRRKQVRKFQGTLGAARAHDRSPSLIE